MRMLLLAGVVSALGGTLLDPAPARAAPFTGPKSPYFLDDFVAGRIYVVQGSSVSYSFPTVNGTSGSAGCGSTPQPGYAGLAMCEYTLAVSKQNGVTTKGWQSVVPGTGGQYSLSGTPTGVTFPSQTTLPGHSPAYYTDGTSDGRYNYAVEFATGPVGGTTVLRYDATWQNPTVQFALAPPPGGNNWDGIAYDPITKSLWLSGFDSPTIANYSLNGTLLSSFTTDHIYIEGLGVDPLDGTLWVTDYFNGRIEQWSRTGELLQRGFPIGLPFDRFTGADFAQDVPEPSSLALFGIGLVGLVGARHRRRTHAAA